MHAPVLRFAAWFVIANIYMLVTWAAVELYRGDKPLGAITQLIYLVAFVAVGTCFYRVASGRERHLAELLRWAAPVTCLALVLGFSVSMLINGVNPVAVLSRTVASANPEIFQKEVFRSSFEGFGLDPETVRGNLRHEVFGAVLLSMYVSTWAIRFGLVATSAQRVAYQISMTSGVLLLALSLSRSILIAALLWPLLSLLRSVRTGQLTTRQVTMALSAAAGVGLLAISGFGLVIWNRFTSDTTGYDSRAENYVGAFAALRDHWLTGGFRTAGVGASSHNFVVDSLLRAGIFSALPAAVIVAVLVLLWIRLVARLHQEPLWMVPLAAALALPLVRLVTSGGGLIPPIEWVTLGFVLGVLTFRRELATTRPTENPLPMALNK